MRSWFYKRGYPKILLEKKWTKLNSLGLPENYPKNLSEKEMNKVKFSGFTRRNRRKKKDVWFL